MGLGETDSRARLHNIAGVGLIFRSCVEQDDLKNLQTELKEKRMMRKKAVEECDEQSERRERAEKLILELHALSDHKEGEHKAKVQQLHEKVRI